MRQITMIGIVGATVILVAGCGSGSGTFANRPTPPEPITITASISNSRVLISPASFGAGPINLEVTNAASSSVSLAIQDANGHAVANLQSINPDTPGDVKHPRGHHPHGHLEGPRLGHPHLLELEGLDGLAFPFLADDPRRHRLRELARLGIDVCDSAQIDGHVLPLPCSGANS
jgi:hypothetical protein